MASSKRKDENNNYFQKAIDNITEDRNKASVLLEEIMNYIIKSPERSKEVGIVAAKYLEVLQRSNEQLVKIAYYVNKATPEDGSFSLDEKEDIYEEIKKTKGK